MATNLLPYPPVASVHPLASSLSRRPKSTPWALGSQRKRSWGRSITGTPMAEKSSAPLRSDEEEMSVLTNIRSPFNDILVVDTPKSRFLLLDSTHNVSSVINKDEKFTGSYWDEFATLPAIIPEGPIAILGLGAGTAARLILDLWPSLHLEGWEIDGILVDKARTYFGLSDLEKPTDLGGVLSINIDDALSPLASDEGRFSGIIVDLFCNGVILPQLNQVETWAELQKRLMPHGRIMVNCGGFNSSLDDGLNCGGFNSGLDDGLAQETLTFEGLWTQNATIRTLCEAFPEKLWWKKLDYNCMAFTGLEPDFDSWSAAVPKQLSSNVKQWKSLNI